MYFPYIFWEGAYVVVKYIRTCGLSQTDPSYFLSSCNQRMLIFAYLVVVEVKVHGCFACNITTSMTRAAFDITKGEAGSHKHPRLVFVVNCHLSTP